MRIHWAYVVLTVIGTMLLTWHLRTKEMDFLTPSGESLPPQEDYEEFINTLADIQPEIKDQPDVNGKIEQPENPDLVDRSTPPEISEDDLGDLAASPGLTTYRTFARENSPDHLFELSSILRARGEFQRALLAFERVIDTCDPGPEALSEAAGGIAALTSNLPRWNIDPTAQTPLNLHLSTASKASDALKKAILKVALTIHESSGDQLEIIPMITSRGKKETSENPSIALWLATTEDKPSSSPVITIRLSPGETDHFPEIALAVFNAIRSHLTQQGYPKPSESKASGQELLSQQMTRLMWQDFAQSLYSQKQKLPEEGATDPEPN